MGVEIGVEKQKIYLFGVKNTKMGVENVVMRCA